MTRNTLFFAGMMLASSTAFSAMAAPISSTDVAKLYSDSEVIESVTIDTDKDSNVVVGKIAGLTFATRLADCEAPGENCATIITYINFNLDRAPTIKDRDVVNSFNNTRTFGRAYLIIDGDASMAGVDRVVDVSDENNFNNRDIAKWGEVVTDFMQFYSSAQAPETPTPQPTPTPTPSPTPTATPTAE